MQTSGLWPSCLQWQSPDISLGASDPGLPSNTSAPLLALAFDATRVHRGATLPPTERPPPLQTELLSPFQAVPGCSHSPARKEHVGMETHPALCSPSLGHHWGSSLGSGVALSISQGTLFTSGGPESPPLSACPNSTQAAARSNVLLFAYCLEPFY